MTPGSVALEYTISVRRGRGHPCVSMTRRIQRPKRLPVRTHRRASLTHLLYFPPRMTAAIHPRGRHFQAVLKMCTLMSRQRLITNKKLRVGMPPSSHIRDVAS